MAKDADLFAAAMADVKPLDKRRRVVRPAPEKAAAHPVQCPVRRPAAISFEPELRADDGSFDRDVSRALSRRQLAPEATIDLHGMTLAAAERAVTRFLEQATARDLRVVLIITGKGLREEGGRTITGRIRSEFFGWLNRGDNRACVRAVRAAHAHHGGTGAFYVLLRRRSSASSRSLRATPQR